MEMLVGNWFFILVLLFCIGVHMFGHGHGYGHGDGRHGDSNKDGEIGGSTRR